MWTASCKYGQELRQCLTMSAAQRCTSNLPCERRVYMQISKKMTVAATGGQNSRSFCHILGMPEWAGNQFLIMRVTCIPPSPLVGVQQMHPHLKEQNNCRHSLDPIDIFLRLLHWIGAPICGQCLSTSSLQLVW